MNLTKILNIVLLGGIFTSCSHHVKTDNDLSKDNLSYIQGLGILGADEKIILFDSQGGLDGIEASGNFFTNKRMASYWVDKNNKDKTSINFAYYDEIDSIKTKDLTRALTYASYMETHKKNGDKFKVYVDEDSSETWRFFNVAMEEWKKKRK